MAQTGLLIDTAELAGLTAEGVLYGIFVAIFGVSSYDLYIKRKKKKSQINYPMAIAGISLFLLATARFTVDTANVFVAFIHHDPRTARIGYLVDVKQPLFVTKHSILIAVLLVGDSFVNYRCWVVWGKNIWIVVFPVILSLLSASFGTYVMWAYSHLPNQTIPSQATFLKAFFSLSLVANAIATLLLAFRIWSIDRQINETIPGDTRMLSIVRIVMESGALNAAYLFAYVMTLAFGSQGLEIMSEMATPLTGIVFSIVILRVGFHTKKDEFWTTQKASLWVAKPQTDISVTSNTLNSDVIVAIHRSRDTDTDDYMESGRSYEMDGMKSSSSYIKSKG